MSEFVFRNLSVKLFTEEAGCPEETGSLVFCGFNCSRIPSVCSPCTQLCTQSGSIDPGCYGRCSLELSCGMYCTLPYTYKTKKAFPVDPLTELAVLKDELRRNLAEVEAAEQRLRAARKPKTAEEIDRLKSELLAAVAELDEQRRGMEGEGSEKG